MNIVFNSSNEYLPYFQTTVFSFCKSNPGKHNVYLLHSGIPKERLRQVQFFVERKCKAVFVPILVEISSLRIDSIKYPTYSIASMMRLFAPTLLPRNLDRVLYLDCDLIVRRGINSFYTSPFLGRSIIAVRDEWNEYHRKRLGIDSTYCCTGVMVLNLDLLRTNLPPNQIISFWDKNYSKFDFLDQDFMNLFFEQRQDGFLEWGSDLENTIVPFGRSVSVDDKSRCRKASVLHYGGPYKPWKINWPNSLSIYYLMVFLRVHFWRALFLLIAQPFCRFSWRLVKMVKRGFRGFFRKIKHVCVKHETIR